MEWIIDMWFMLDMGFLIVVDNVFLVVCVNGVHDVMWIFMVVSFIGWVGCM